LSSEFIVVGGGALGLATAEALLKQGASVIVLERGHIGRESSWAGGGILSPLCPWDYPNAVTRLTSRGATLFGAWAASLYAATGIDPEYLHSGMLVLPPFDLALARHWCAAHEMRMEVCDGGLLLPDIAQVRNPRLVQAQRARVEQLGGHIIEQCEVLGLDVGSDAVQKLQTTRGEYSAENFIVTAGAWSKQVLGHYALALEIKPIRGQMLLFKFDTPPLPHILLQQGLYLIPRRDGHLLVGSTLEDVGFDKSITTVARDSLRYRAEALLPALRDMSIIQHWAGLRPGSPNNIPTIGRHPALNNLYINSGHFRYGVTMTPVSVELLLNEINGTVQPFDVSPYDASWGV
jgi:glycine oxidase